MDDLIGEFKLQKLLCSDDEKSTFLAEHTEFKTPYIVQVVANKDCFDESFSCPDHLVTLFKIQKEGAVVFTAKELKAEAKITSLKDYVDSLSELLDETKIVPVLLQIAQGLHHYYQTRQKRSFGLKLENCFLDHNSEALIVDHASSSWRSFLNEQNQRGTIEDSSIVSFGQIAYFLMTKEWPEGYFPLPSEINLKLDKKWDEFVKSCLHHKPSKRFGSFFDICTLLEKYKAQPSILKPVLKPQVVERPEFEPNPGQIFQQELVVGKYMPEARASSDVEPLLSEMIVIPAGEYERGSQSGSRDEMPKHKVQLSAFALDVHPVTNEQFVRFLEVMGGEKDAQNNDMIRLKDSRIKRVAGKLMIESGYSKHPVVGISWYGAQAYAKWVGKRLPTEAEWEVAASCTKCYLYPTGDNIDKGMANFFFSDTTPVMSYKPSEIGLYDMAGNVYEWCSDWYGVHYYEASLQEPQNPKGPVQGVYRVLRGGCWKSLKEDLRVSHRHRNNPFAVNSTYGFRCAADAV